MDYPAIFSATLGLHHPWHIVSVTFGRDERRMDIRLDVFLGNLFTCPCCGKPTPPCGYEEETWFHEDFFGYATYLNARVPQLQCDTGILAADRPWSRTGSRFSRLLPNGAVVTALASTGLEPAGEAPVPRGTSESRAPTSGQSLAVRRNC